MWFSKNCFIDEKVEWWDQITTIYEMDDIERLANYPQRVFSNLLLQHSLNIRSFSFCYSFLADIIDDCGFSYIKVNKNTSDITVIIERLSPYDFEMFIAFELLIDGGFKIDIDIDQEEPFAKIKVYL